MAHGKHRKSKDNKVRVAAVVAVTGTGVVVPMTLATPASAASVDAWDKVAGCESSHKWNRPDGDFGKSSGGLQFQPASWDTALNYLKSHGVDISGYPQGPGHQAYKATKRQQIIAGEALLAVQGPGAWTCNRKVGSPLGRSMFEGGVSPYASKPDPQKPKAQNHKKAPADRKSAGTHRVVPGEWLSKIAKARYGDAGKWTKIYDANRRVIGSDPNLIHPGQKLNLPGGSVTERVQTPERRPAAAHPAPAPSGDYVRPVDARVTQHYGNPRASYTLGYHTGTDFTAPSGTRVIAAAGGVVVAPDTSSAYGINVKIKHPNGTYTLYAHLSGRTVVVGQAVSAGQLVGYVGSTGNSTGPHLHFEVRVGNGKFAAGNFLNPVTWLRSHGVSI